MTTWDFDYTNDQISVGTDVLVGDKFVQDGSSYTTFTSSSINLVTAWEDDVELYIVGDDDVEHLIGWNETITITATAYAYYKLKNTTTDFDVSMFDSRGRPMITQIKYA